MPTTEGRSDEGRTEEDVRLPGDPGSSVGPIQEDSQGGGVSRSIPDTNVSSNTEQYSNGGTEQSPSESGDSSIGSTVDERTHAGHVLGSFNQIFNEMYSVPVAPPEYYRATGQHSDEANRGGDAFSDVPPIFVGGTEQDRARAQTWWRANHRSPDRETTRQLLGLPSDDFFITEPARVEQPADPIGRIVEFQRTGVLPPRPYTPAEVSVLTHTPPEHQGVVREMAESGALNRLLSTVDQSASMSVGNINGVLRVDFTNDNEAVITNADMDSRRELFSSATQQLAQEIDTAFLEKVNKFIVLKSKEKKRDDTPSIKLDDMEMERPCSICKDYFCKCPPPAFTVNQNGDAYQMTNPCAEVAIGDGRLSDGFRARPVVEYESETATEAGVLERLQRRDREIAAALAAQQSMPINLQMGDLQRTELINQLADINAISEETRQSLLNNAHGNQSAQETRDRADALAGAAAGENLARAFAPEPTVRTDENGFDYIGWSMVSRPTDPVAYLNPPNVRNRMTLDEIAEVVGNNGDPLPPEINEDDPRMDDPVMDAPIGDNSDVL